MKGDAEVVLMIVFFFAGAALMAYAENLSVVPYANTVLGAVATLAAAYFGAKYAYKLQMDGADQKVICTQVEAGNKAVFELVKTFNQFYAIQKQLIDIHRDNPARHLLFRPMVASIHEMRVDFDALAFLFETDDRNLLGQLAMFQVEVSGMLEIIAQRSRLHIEVVQPAVERCTEQSGGVFTINQIEEKLGERNTQIIKELTNLMVSGVDEIVSSSEKYIIELNRVLKKKFPERRIISMIAPQK